MRILAVDPGGTTGWVLLDTVTKGFEKGQLVGHEWEHTDALVGFVLSGRVDVLVVEDFQLRVGLQRGAASRRDTLAPVRITETLLYTLYRHSLRGSDAVGGLDSSWGTSGGSSRVVKQQVADAKAFATDERLREWGYYVTGGHARDAMRHAVLYAAKHRGE